MQIEIKVDSMALSIVYKHLGWLKENVGGEIYEFEGFANCPPNTYPASNEDWDNLYTDLTACYLIPKDFTVVRIERFTGEGWTLYLVRMGYPMLLTTAYEHRIVINFDEDQHAVMFKLAHL